MQKWSDALWQTHHRRHGGASKGSLVWPQPASIRSLWPLAAEELIDALLWCEAAQDGRPGYRVEDWAFLDPPKVVDTHWRELYAVELVAYPKLGWDFAQPNPLAAVFRRAGLRSGEQDVAVSVFRGASTSSVSRALGRQKQTVATLLDRACVRLRGLVEPNPVWVA